MEKQRTILLTGATGLVGSYLTKIFLESGHKVYALARKKDGKSAKERVWGVLKFWDEGAFEKKSNNLSVVEGDVTKEDLGLENETKAELESEVEEIINCAAVTKFNWPIDEIRKINTEGVRNLLDLGVEFSRKGRLRKVSHLSTIFVYGDCDGVFRERDLDIGQNFNNTYSQSKFEAEKIVNEYRGKGLWIDIFRPAIIIGESSTGKILSFDRAFYQAVRSWDLELFDYYPGKDSFLFKITFVDELCESICRISFNTSTPNMNYHPFGPQEISLEKIIDLSSRFLGFKKPQLISTADFFNKSSSAGERMLLQYNFSFKDTNIKLDSEATISFLKKCGFSFADFRDELFFNQLRYGVEAGYFKKR